MRQLTVPRTLWRLVVLVALSMLAGLTLVYPTQPETPTPASVEVGATPSPKFHYQARETVIGAYIMHFTYEPTTHYTPKEVLL